MSRLLVLINTLYDIIHMFHDPSKIEIAGGTQFWQTMNVSPLHGVVKPGAAYQRFARHTPRMSAFPANLISFDQGNPCSVTPGFQGCYQPA